MTIQVGSRYKITRRMKAGITTFVAKVYSVENRNEYVYFGFTPKDQKDGEFGYAKFYGDKTPEYGVIKMELLP